MLFRSPGATYRIQSLGNTDWNAVAGTIQVNYAVGDELVAVITGSGTGTAYAIYYILTINSSDRFTVTATNGGVSQVVLDDATAIMYAEAANERMAIYTISVDPVTSIVTLTLTTQTYKYNSIQVVRGDYYRSAYLYYPGAPAPGLVRVDWQPVIVVPTTQTTFDQNSMQFVDPVDMYDPGETFDKYLVFPKSNILV